MLYRSTRGRSPLLNFEDAVLTGLAPDGGLYIPTSIPTFSLQEIVSWAKLEYYEIAFNIFRPFVGPEEIGDVELKALLKRSFATFSNADVTPLVPLAKEHSDGQFYLLELFHGPTFAFKDVALQVLGNLFEFFLTRRNETPDQDAHEITVLGATSGDTGGAAIYGLRGKKFVKVFILHPSGRISKVQEAQMTSVLDSNVYNVGVEGTFDDCQDAVKALFNKPEFRHHHHLAAINSINWARILAQTTYYFSSMYQLWKQLDVKVDELVGLDDEIILKKLPKVTYTVPTGNFGDILAGFYSHALGLPNIYRLCIATNSNDILHRFLETGKYEKRMNHGKVEQVKETLSPAMDILVSSNFERLVWYLEAGSISKSQSECPAGGKKAHSYSDEVAKKASERVHQHMHDLSATGGFTIPKDALEAARRLFASQCVSDQDTMDGIARYYKSTKYILDPHTSVGVVSAERLVAQDAEMKSNPVVVLSTAHPGKFPEAVMEATSISEYAQFAPKEMVEFLKMPKKCVQVLTGGDKLIAIDSVAKVIEDVAAGKDVFTSVYNLAKTSEIAN
jgi:threonine synthase